MTIRTLIEADADGKNYRLVHVPGGRSAIDDQTRETHQGPCCQLQVNTPAEGETKASGRHVWLPADRQACLAAAEAAGAPAKFLDEIRAQSPKVLAEPYAAPKLEVLQGGATSGGAGGGGEETANSGGVTFSDDLDELPFRELQERAKELELSAGGNAEELRARIRAHVQASAQSGSGGGGEETDE